MVSSENIRALNMTIEAAGDRKSKFEDLLRRLIIIINTLVNKSFKVLSTRAMSSNVTIKSETSHLHLTLP